MTAEHGTVERYWQGCHEPCCRPAAAADSRARRAANAAAAGRSGRPTPRRWVLTAEGEAVLGMPAGPVPVPVLSRAGLAAIARAHAEEQEAT